jgi:hypothetical protein
MIDNPKILNPNKFKYNQEFLRKNPLKIKLRKSQKKGAKRTKQGYWVPCSQGDKALVKGMELCIRIWGGSIQIMVPYTMPMGSSSEVCGTLV